MLLSQQLDVLSRIEEIIALHSKEQDMLVDILDFLGTRLQSLESENTRLRNALIEIKAGGKLIQRIETIERDMIIDALKKSRGNMTAAAKELGITLRMVRYKILRLNINLSQFLDLPYKFPNSKIEYPHRALGSRSQ
jgi:transcriptional regulator with GAF, ATPase, and Fis domain